MTSTVTTRLFQSQNQWNFFSIKLSILLTMTFHKIVIRFPSLSWHHMDIVFVNQDSHKTVTCILIFIHLHYIILKYLYICIHVLASLSTRVYTRVMNENFTHLVHSFIQSSCDFTAQHPHKREYHINIFITLYLHVRTSTFVFHYSFHYKSLQKCRMQIFNITLKT